MAERLSKEEAERLSKKVAAAERSVAAAKLNYEDRMARRAVVFLDVFEAGLTIPEIARDAHRSPAMVSLELSKARKARTDQQAAAS